MAVYVDQIIDYGESVRSRLGHSKWCHMTADTQQELHEAAGAIGLKRAWFQNKDGVTWHYDIVPSKRILAIRNGALSVDYRKMAEIIGERRKEQSRGKEEGTGVGGRVGTSERTDGSTGDTGTDEGVGGPGGEKQADS